MKKISVRFVAIYQLVSAIAFAVPFAVGWGSTDGLSLAICALLGIINLAVGLALLRNVRWASYIGTANMAFQVPAVNSQLISYNYVGVGDLSIFAKLDPSSGTYLFGPVADFSPGTFSVRFALQFQGVEIYLGVLAMIMTGVLARNCFQRS